MKTLLTSIAVFVTFVLVFACGEKEQMKTEKKQTMESHEGHSMETEMAANMVVDPVCGMKIKKADAAATVKYQGKTYYFCMESDKNAFEGEPEKYIVQN